MIITKSTTAASKIARQLIDGIGAAYVLADKAYDTNDIISHIVNQKGQWW